jgi:signal transduction histidine kinase
MPSQSRLGWWALYVAALLGGSVAVLIVWRLPPRDDGARLALTALAAATLAAEVFTVDFPDRKHISGGYIFPLVAASVVHPAAGVIAAGGAGLLSGALTEQRLRSALFHGPQLALAAALAAATDELLLGPSALEVSGRGLLSVLLFAGVYTSAAWLLGRAEEWLVGIPASHAAVDLLTNLLLIPLPLLLDFIYKRTGFNGLLFSSLALALLLIVVRAYVNLATLHGQLRQAYARLAEQEGRLERALETNREMSQVLSHDLRGPLTSVMGYAELLRAALGKPESVVEKQRQYIESIETNSRRILTLADKVLDLQRLEEGGEVEMVTVDPASLVRQVSQDMRVRAEQKGLEFRLEIDDELPRIQTSEWMLREIAENLVSNAIKYTRQGSVGVRASVNDAGLLLEVEDTGFGISSEDQTKLFTKFFRSSNKEVRTLRGTGLGLALTRSMVERLGGRIEVFSKVDTGSRFTVHLPLVPSGLPTLQETKRGGAGDLG